jgi:hypothetical protein
LRGGLTLRRNASVMLLLVITLHPFHRPFATAPARCQYAPARYGYGFVTEAAITGFVEIDPHPSPALAGGAVGRRLAQPTSWQPSSSFGHRNHRVINAMSNLREFPDRRPSASLSPYLAPPTNTPV